MELSGRHWTMAVSAALLVHAAVAGAVLWDESPPGAQSSGLGGIEVSLGAAGGAPGSVAPAAPEAPVVDAVSPMDTPNVVSEEMAADDVPPEQALLAAPAEPVEVAETSAVPEVVPVETSPAEVVEAVPLVSPPPPPTRKPHVPEPVAAAPVSTSDAAVVEPPKAVAAAEPSETSAVAPEPSARGAGGQAGTTESADAGSADADSAGGGSPGDAADYLALLRAWLERHKEYPTRAQARRQEGTVLLFFAIDSQGQVLEYRIEHSSGFSVLDHEVERMIHRAQPLPGPPAGTRAVRLEFLVPVRFSLR